MAALETETLKMARDLKAGDVVIGMGCPRTVLTAVTITKRGLVRSTDSNWGIRHHNPSDAIRVITF